jgi:hypothetical protein
MIDGRKGNGNYWLNLKTQPRVWLRTEAQPAIRRCSFCKTKRQQEKMWELTKEKWENDGEYELAKTFARTYIRNVNFSNWYYAASGAHGSVPCNNPMERHNQVLKGSPHFDGFIEIGKDMYSCLTKEFVMLVYHSSNEFTSPTSYLPVLDYRIATKDDLFMQFQSILDPVVDIKRYKNGWLINDLEYLLEEITDKDIQNMEMALEGIIEPNAGVEQGNDIRDVLLSRTKRFHLVKEAVRPSATGRITFFECDCREYYYHRWCFPSAYMQHRNQLQLLGEKISKKASFSTKYQKKMWIRKKLENASKRKGKKYNHQNTGN